MAIEEVLLIGGAAGVGKSSVGWETSVQLSRSAVAHWHLEGDVLDAAWPRPADDQDGRRMTVDTLRAMAGVFAAEGYRRCVYVQTASVVDFGLVRRALGTVRLHGVLLTASEPTRIARLSRREIGSDLDRHLVSSRRMAAHLQDHAPEWVARVPTDDRTVTEIARDVIALSGWAAVQAHGGTASPSASSPTLPGVDPTGDPDLTEVREAIDALDGRIVELIGERQAWVERAGRFKRSRGEDAVRAPARVEAVIERVRALAAPAGASPDVVERAYRALIAAFVELELDVHGHEDGSR